MPLAGEALRFFRTGDQERIRSGQYEKEGASAILRNQAGAVLLQLRDNIPTIRYPNHWSLPGGLLEPGETPKEALRRELLEELTWEAIDLQPYGMILDDYGNLINYFTARLDAKLETLTLREGREIRFFGALDLDGVRIPPHARAVLGAVFADTEAG